MKRIGLLAACAAILICFTAVDASARKARKSAEYRKYEAGLLDIIKRANIPSIQCVFVTADDSMSFEVVNRDFYKNAECVPEKQPLSDRTIYQACSISKLPLSWIACKLIEEGDLELNTPLVEYFPGLLDYFATDEDKELAKLLTPRICMTHRTGLDNKTYQKNAMAFKFTPDDRYLYSGPGIYCLQMTIEKIKGRNLNELAHEYIFDPLGMDHTNYVWVPEYDDTHANGYNSQKWEDIEMDKIRKRSSSENAAFSMRTTASECTKFIRAVMHHWGMKEETYAMMLDTYGEPIPAEYKEREKQSLFRSLGFSCEKNEEFGTFWHHGGNNGRYKGNVIFIPSLDASLVYFTNAQHPYELNTSIHNLFFQPKTPFSFPRKGKKPLPE